MTSFFSDPVAPVDYRAPRAVRVADGRIQHVEDASRPRLFLDGAEVPLPDGAIVLPGLVDTHCHLIGLGMMQSRVALRGAGSAEECARRVAARAAATPPGEWILGFGWNQEEWGSHAMPNAVLLDAAAPRNPVVLIRVDSHASWCNTAALAAAGISGEAGAVARVEGGSILLDDRGRPTGVLLDNAMKLVETVMPLPTTEQRKRWIEQGAAQCAAFGITEVHDMNVEPERIEAMTRAAEGGGLPIRCQVFLKGEADAWRAVPYPDSLGPNLRAVGVKYFADGALGSRGALLLEPYSDQSTTHGIAVMVSEDLIAAAAEPLARGFAVATHAIGDAANRMVLDAYGRLRRTAREGLLRIEHAQTVNPIDLQRFASLRVMPAVQAVHCTSDAAMAEARLGPERCAHAYPWAALRALGLPLLGGSDFPIESADPLVGLRAFTMREPVPGAGPWHGEQRITRGEALDAYTAWAPMGIPGGARRGCLRPGYAADICVLSADPFERSDARAVLTVMGGRIVASAVS